MAHLANHSRSALNDAELRAFYSVRELSSVMRSIVALVIQDRAGSNHGPSEAFLPTEADHLLPTLRAASRALQGFLIAQARASGLGLLEFLLLIRAADDEGVVTRDAGRALGVSTGTMTGLADRLESGNLVRRHAHPTDRRLLVLKATPKGRRVVDRALNPVLTEIADLVRLVEPTEFGFVSAFMEQLASLLLKHGIAFRPAQSRPSPARTGQ